MVRYAALAFLAATLAGVLIFRFVPIPVTPLMLIRLAEQGLDGRPLRLDKTWRPLERISPALAQAVIASEDQRFFEHHGFDWEAIGAAFTANGRGERKLGASTISQQTAKNLFLWPARTWLRKGLEAWFTLWIETLWSKRRILETYLNIIETGEGTYGAEAAARRYFGLPAARLDDSQAALIAAALPNPRAWSPARPTAYLFRRRNWILRQMGRLGPLPWDVPATAARPVRRPAPRDGGNLRATATPVERGPAAAAAGPGNPDPDPLRAEEPVPAPEDTGIADSGLSGPPFPDSGGAPFAD